MPLISPLFWHHHYGKVAAGWALAFLVGATNHKLNDKVVVAKIGAVLPGNFKIKKSKIRDVESYGMLCSEAELGFAKESEGIIILPTQIGRASCREGV